MAIGLFDVMRLGATGSAIDTVGRRLLGFGYRLFVHLDNEKLKARF